MDKDNNTPSDKSPDDDFDDEQPMDNSDGSDDSFGFDLSKMAGRPGMPNPDQLRQQMSQFMSPDGGLDLDKLVGGLRAAIGMSNSGADPTTGMNWPHVTSNTKKALASHGDDPPSPTPSTQMLDAFNLANLWLDEATSFSGEALRLELWTRAHWVDATMSAWRSMVSPIVMHLGDALVELGQENLTAGADTAPQLAGLSDVLAPMMRQTASEFYSARLSTALADLAAKTLSGTDAVLPLVAPPVVALLPLNIAAFTDGLVAPATDTGVYLLMRESARQRLFAATPWLGPQILALIEHYAREISIDPSSLRFGLDIDNIEDLTPQTLVEMSSKVQDRLFRPATSPDQQAILARLETLISLVEGWVDTVVNQAAGPWLASATALAETMQRRRAAQGPTEGVLTSLVGLKLCSRRVRDAANLWAYLGHQRGTRDRDALWHHPDMMPQVDDLDDVIGFVARTGDDATPDAIDAQLNWLVDQWRRDASGSDDPKS